MVEGHQVLLDLLLVNPHLVTSNAIRSSLSVLSRSVVFVLHHALLFLVRNAAYLEFVNDFHLGFGGTVRTDHSRLHVLRIVVIGSSLLTSFKTLNSMIGPSHAASVKLKLRMVRLVLRGGGVRILLAQGQLTSLILT